MRKSQSQLLIDAEFWEKRGSLENAIKNYNEALHRRCPPEVKNMIALKIDRLKKELRKKKQ